MNHVRCAENPNPYDGLDMGVSFQLAVYLEKLFQAAPPFPGTVYEWEHVRYRRLVRKVYGYEYHILYQVERSPIAPHQWIVTIYHICEGKSGKPHFAGAKQPDADDENGLYDVDVT
jgi:hypothetical protein